MILRKPSWTFYQDSAILSNRGSIYTAQKMSVFGVILVRIFPHSDSFHAVLLMSFFYLVPQNIDPLG